MFWAHEKKPSTAETKIQSNSPGERRFRSSNHNWEAWNQEFTIHMEYLSTLLSKWPKNICHMNHDSDFKRDLVVMTLSNYLAIIFFVVIKLLLHWGLVQKEIYKRVFACFLSFKKSSLNEDWKFCKTPLNEKWIFTQARFFFKRFPKTNQAQVPWNEISGCFS